MIANWAAIEVDFRREYGISLVHEQLSFRYFFVLLAGLSRDALFRRALPPPQESDALTIAASIKKRRR